MSVDSPLVEAVTWITLGIVAVALWAAVVTLGIRGKL